MKILQATQVSAEFTELTVQLTDDEKTDTVNGDEFRAICLLEDIKSKYGILGVLLVAPVLAVWLDLKK